MASDHGQHDRGETVARAFHEAYERLAPDHGYQTREASAKPWADVPANNRNLMIAVARDLLDRGVIRADQPRRQGGTVRDAQVTAVRGVLLRLAAEPESIHDQLAAEVVDAVNAAGEAQDAAERAGVDDTTNPGRTAGSDERATLSRGAETEADP